MSNSDDRVNPVQVQKFLGGIDYPCSKQDLLNTAKSEGADERVLGLLNKLPERIKPDRNFHY